MIGQATFRRQIVLAAILGTMLVVVARARGDLQIAGYQDRLHDPFYVGNDKAFIGAAYNWSGYGRFDDPTGTGSNWKQMAMISDNYFITANHFRPIRGDDPVGSVPKVRFYRTTDPNGEYRESEIAVEGSVYKGAQIGLTDLWVGKLAHTPPDWVVRYPLAKRQEATNYLSYTDNDLFIFGQDTPRSFTSARVGRNEISSVSTYGTYQWDYSPVTGLGADEAQTQSGDSGGPSFYTTAGVPVLAGVHTYSNYDTGVSTHLQEIRNAIGEPISVSTGLLGDVDGNFSVSLSDLGIVAGNYGKATNVRYADGDITGDGHVNLSDLLNVLGNLNRSLYAPADFDRDGDVDDVDLAAIGSNWLKKVGTPFTMGDANGDSIVNVADVDVFDRDQFRAYFGPLPAPLAPVSGDVTGDGNVDALDLNAMALHLNETVPKGTNGDVDGNGIVNELDRTYILARFGTSFGDINSDRQVGVGDFIILANNWNRYVTLGRFSGDLNGDRIVNALDASILFSWWGEQGGTFPGMMIPEPASATLFALATLMLASGRPRRRMLTSPAPC